MKRFLLISVVALLAAVACVDTEESLDIVSGRKIDSFTAMNANDNSRTFSV